MHGHTAIVGRRPSDALSGPVYNRPRAASTGDEAADGAARGAVTVALALLIGLVAAPLEPSPIAVGASAARLVVGQLRLRPFPDLPGTWCGSVDRPVDAVLPTLGTPCRPPAWHRPSLGPTTTANASIVRWQDRTTGEVMARLAVSGPATQHGDLVIRWNELRPRATATIGGRIGGRNIVASMPSP